MPLISIPTFATGDTIEASWANDLRDNSLLLDARTGGDPGAAGKVMFSNGVLGAIWTTILAIIGYTPVNRAGDTMSGDLTAPNLAAGNTLATGGSATIGNALSVAGVLSAASAAIVGAITAATATFTGAVNALNVAASNNVTAGNGVTAVGTVAGATVAASSTMTKAGVAVLNQTEGDARYALIANKVPSGAVVWFETAAELTAAGAAWAAYTAAEGRLLVGAGASASSQTFTEATNYGSTWTPSSGLTGTVGTLDVSGNTDSTSPVNAVGTGAPTAILGFAGGHTHGSAGLSVSGTPGISGTGTVWLPYMRAGVWGRKT